MGMLGTPRRQFGNIVGHVKGVADMTSLGDWTAQQFDPRLNWNDVEWIKKRWGGKLILKGIQDPEDARLAVETGADALIVSNHGGRQLDGAQSSIEALPAVVDAVGRDIEVHMDGGIRSGQDVLKALALGAKGTYIGRAFLYGLGAMGQPGATKALQIIHKELDLSMAFCGRTRVADVDRSVLLPGTFPTASRGARRACRSRHRDVLPIWTWTLFMRPWNCCATRNCANCRWWWAGAVWLHPMELAPAPAGTCTALPACATTPVAGWLPPPATPPGVMA